MTEETSEFRSFVLTHQNVLKYWPTLEPHIQKALDYGAGEYSTFDIFKQAIDNLMQIWVTVDKDDKLGCVTVTQVSVYPDYKALQILCLTAVNQTVTNMRDQFHCLEDFAKQNGCSSLRVWGRKGWQRKLRSLKSRQGNEFKTQYYVYSQEI
ncbi:putative acyltransferase [Roseobacter phage CRP-738]|nr:putative acyltransferase [Roseobacter phage CRP-738]